MPGKDSCVQLSQKDKEQLELSISNRHLSTGRVLSSQSGLLKVSGSGQSSDFLLYLLLLLLVVKDLA